MNLDKQYILDVWQNTPRSASQLIKRNRVELYTQINQLPGKTFSEKSWLYINGELPKCIHCGNSTRYKDFSRGYSTYCSTKCLANSTDIQTKKQHTNTLRYGVDHFSKTAEYKEKFKATCIEKYGVINPGQITDKKLIRARNKQLTFFTQLVDDIKEFTSPCFSFDEYSYVRDTSLLWNCVLCNNQFTSSIFGKIPKCPNCFPTNNNGGPSSIEFEIRDEIKKFYDGPVIENSRSIIPPKELDLFFPKLNFAIEVNGIYWHSSKFCDKTYHQEKYNLCKAAGISLLMITDYEWQTKKSLIISMIKHRMQVSDTKLYARSCNVKVISSKLAREFLSRTHIHGYSNASIHYGLYSNTNELVSVLSISTRHRFKQANSNLEIVRLGFSKRVIGALGKLLKHVKNEYPNTVITTYADLRYGSGEVYLKNNFELKLVTKPGYWYFYNNTMYHRLSWTKSKLVSMGYDSTKTEEEIMTSINALRIYDCGHNYYELRNTAKVTAGIQSTALRDLINNLDVDEF